MTDVHEPLSVWTVYSGSDEHPDHYVARRYYTSPMGDVPTPDVVVEPDLESITVAMTRRGLFRIERHAEDPPHVVEVWL